MKMRKIKNSMRIYLIVGLSLFFSKDIISQISQTELEAQRKTLQEEIRNITKSLSSEEEEKDNLLEEIEDLSQIVSKREKLISTIRTEIDTLDAKIEKNNLTIQNLEKDLEVLKKLYANTIYNSYKSRSKQNKLMFILSSESFTQAYKRLTYMEQYNSYRKSQGEEIVRKKKEINILNTLILDDRKEQSDLLEQENIEKSGIEKNEKAKRRRVNQVKKNEGKYKSEINKKQSEERKIDDQITKLIRDAIAATKKEKELTEQKENKNIKFTLNNAEAILSKKFYENKGKFSWPVKSKHITREFGTQSHPSIEGIKINSIGIHISTPKGAKVFAIFEGTVLAVLLHGNKKTILLQHGDYISVYKNLSTTIVKKGDKVSRNQEIGVVYSDTNGKTIIVFAIKKETKNEDPMQWIVSK